MTTLDTGIVSHEWATRPHDQRHLSLIDLRDYQAQTRRESAEVTGPLSKITVKAASPKEDAKALVIEGKAGIPYHPTHHSFRQLCIQASVPHSYVTRLPADLAARNLNYGLQTMDDKSGVLLLQEHGTGDNATRRLRAITSETYGRIWNDDVLRPIIDRYGDGVTGEWKVPSEFGKVEGFQVTKQNTTIYGSTQDMFIFLCDEVNRVEVPNRRDGKPGTLARGWYLSNSEVGSEPLRLGFMLFDYLCQNRIIWGAENFQEVTLKHYKGTPDRWLKELQPTLVEYGRHAASVEQKQIAAAMSAKIEFDAFASKRGWASKFVDQLLLTHQEEESRPIETLWDAATALTAYSRSIPYTDERMKLDREAGKILAMAA